MYRPLIVPVLVLLAACGVPTARPAPGGGSDSGAGVALPSDPATIIGQITSLQGTTMLVEENPGQPNTGRKIAFTLGDDTVVAEREGTNLLPRSTTDLAVGQRVAAWADGPLAESFPEQGGAAAVVISIDAPD